MDLAAALQHSGRCREWTATGNVSEVLACDGRGLLSEGGHAAGEARALALASEASALAEAGHSAARSKEEEDEDEDEHREEAGEDLQRKTMATHIGESLLDEEGGERVVLMLRNIACRYLENEVCDLLHQAGLGGLYYSVSLPLNCRCRKASNRGYAFVDLKRASYEIAFREKLDGKPFGNCASNKRVQVVLANKPQAAAQKMHNKAKGSAPSSSFSANVEEDGSAGICGPNSQMVASLPAAMEMLWGLGSGSATHGPGLGRLISPLLMVNSTYSDATRGVAAELGEDQDTLSPSGTSDSDVRGVELGGFRPPPGLQSVAVREGNAASGDAIFPDEEVTQKIIQGKKSSTVIMLRNIACRFMKDDIMALLDEAGLRGMYNSIHVPGNKRGRQPSNRGYAFIDLKEPSYVDVCRTLLDGKQLGNSCSTKQMEVVLAESDVAALHQKSDIAGSDEEPDDTRRRQQVPQQRSQFEARGPRTQEPDDTRRRQQVPQQRSQFEARGPRTQEPVLQWPQQQQQYLPFGTTWYAGQTNSFTWPAPWNQGIFQANADKLGAEEMRSRTSACSAYNRCFGHSPSVVALAAAIVSAKQVLRMDACTLSQTSSVAGCAAHS